MTEHLARIGQGARSEHQDAVGAKDFRVIVSGRTRTSANGAPLKPWGPVVSASGSVRLVDSVTVAPAELGKMAASARSLPSMRRTASGSEGSGVSAPGGL